MKRLATTERQPLTVGVLGGPGPAATRDLMNQLHLESRRGHPQHGVRMLVDYNPLVPDSDEAILGIGPSPGPVLATMAQGLERAGADFVVMACGTAHAFQFEIERSIGLPFVSLIEETAAATARAAQVHGSRVGVLASQGCLTAGLYQEALARRGLTCLVPDDALQSQLMILRHEIRAGDVGGLVSQRMAKIVQDLQSLGADLVVAGCTEVSRVLGPEMVNAPLIDATEALASALVDYALGASALPAAFSCTSVGEA